MDIRCAPPLSASASLPPALQREVVRRTGIPITAVTPAHGGFASQITLHVDAGPQRFFLKAVPLASASRFSRLALAREERVYRELAPILAPYAPALLGSFKASGWHALLLEDVGDPPATLPDEAGLAWLAQAYAAYHRGHAGQILPPWIARRPWRGMIVPRPRRIGRAARSGEAGGAGDLRRRLRTLALPLRSAPASALLHLDTRRDNLALQGGRLRLFDWAMAAAGPPEYDVAAFAQSIAAEGGPDPENFVAAYREIVPLDAHLLIASAADIAGYFLDVIDQAPPESALSRKRRAQLNATLGWLARTRLVDIEGDRTNLLATV